MLDDSKPPGDVDTDHLSEPPFAKSSADSFPSSVDTNSNLELEKFGIV